MLFLIRTRSVDILRRRIGTKGVLEIREARYQIPNLNHVASVRSYTSNETLPSNVVSSDSRVKTFLDYVTDTYKNKKWEKECLDEIVDLNLVAHILRQRIDVMEDIKSLQDLAKEDKDMEKVAREEERMYNDRLNKLDECLLDIIVIHISKESFNSIIIEVVAGIGGQEAMLFAKELFNMYIGYVNHLGLNHEILELCVSDKGGIRSANILVNDSEAFDKFKFEAGIHRVQRVPITDKSARIHTSTVSVAVLPEPTDIQIQLDNKDLRIDTKKASGAGGQHVNTTDSAVRITHVPTGLIVTSETQRSQIKNKEIAMMKLRSLLYEEQLRKQTSFINELRNKQKGQSLRSDKIRTYNYNQDRITDHRLINGTVHNLAGFLEGGIALEKLVSKLEEDIQKKMLLEIVNKFENR